MNGFPFRATLEPDGQKSHWLKVDRKMCEAAQTQDSCGRPKVEGVVVRHHPHCDALELLPEERLELARRLIESVVVPAPLNQALSEGILRIRDLATGRVKGVSEEEFLATLKR